MCVWGEVNKELGVRFWIIHRESPSAVLQAGDPRLCANASDPLPHSIERPRCVAESEQHVPFLLFARLERFTFCCEWKRPSQRQHGERETKTEQSDHQHRDDEGAQRIPTACREGGVEQPNERHPKCSRHL